MAWESLKKNLMVELAGLIDHRAETADRALLHDLAGAFYGRFPADDMRERAVENMYGCLYGLLSGMREWPEPKPEVKIFNPEIQSHGWESKYTVLTVHCRGVPFTTASVRGELNRRNLRIHAIVSTNIVASRDEKGGLLSISERPNTDGAAAYHEAILYFEIGRHSRPEELEELRASLLDILREVELVVDDFPAMCERLHEVAATIDCSDCVPDDYRDEAIAFLQWLENDHMTILGYECLEVDHSGPEQQVSSPQGSRLGILRLHETSGCPDLGADLHEYYLDDLNHKQLSFAKSGLRSRVHRLTYPDFVEIKEFDEAGQVIRQHRFMGLFT